MLNTILLLLIIVTAGIAFNLQARRNIRRQREEFNREMLEIQQEIQPLTEEERTIDLIGKEEYEQMKVRIEEIIERHGHQNCLTVSLTCGPDTIEGAHELHRLLPGHELKLSACVDNGVDMVDVFFNGSRIGCLALMDAATIRNIMDKNHIRGAYVAEQNCYGSIDSHSLELIVFYETKKKTSVISESSLLNNIGKAGKEIITGKLTEKLCQN